MRYLILILLLLVPFSYHAQQPKTGWSSSEILLEIKKLSKTHSVLYVAAHPDDENTRLIAYMANDHLARTGYISLTRGDGGQNLIGAEKGELIGVIRTQELVEARKIDGGEQFFSRAVDFGYSKTADETFEFWDKNEVLSDLVWTIRTFKPDIIITRFSTLPGRGHGHHTASAILAEEAFKLAGDKSAFREQLRITEAWQPKRLIHNNSTWWEEDLAERAMTNDSIVPLNVGTYNPLLGKSHGEIAAMSRSMHKSQGFGAAWNRDEIIEHLQLEKGDIFESDPFEGIDTSWKRYGSLALDESFETLINEYDPHAPEKSLSKLFDIKRQMEAIPQKNSIIKKKIEQLNNVILASLGIYAESLTEANHYVYGEPMAVSAEIINRSNVPVRLKSITIAGDKQEINDNLNKGKLTTFDLETVAPEVSPHPYWLKQPYKNMFVVETPSMRVLAENPNPLPVEFELEIQGKTFQTKTKLFHKYTDRVKGQVYEPVVFLPQATISPDAAVILFESEKEKELVYNIQAHRDSVKGIASLQAPKNWKIEPETIDFELARKGESVKVTFKAYPPSKSDEGEVHASLMIQDEQYDEALVTIDHPHIFMQRLLPKATVKVVKEELQTNGKKQIGYIMGAGDEIPHYLSKIGIEIDLLDPDKLPDLDLEHYDAIITGIRAYNTEKILEFNNKYLLKYVENGGNLIVQYSVSYGLITDNIGPHPFTVSRSRVTDENAKTYIIDGKHPLFNTPNKIKKKDFDNWVQERGLYFAEDWGENYTALIGWADPDEERHEGGLIVSEHGKGKFIYTGISFFRQLPAGVPGAYKLMLNMICWE